MMEWVRQLTAQLIKKFGCMDAIRKWSPLLTDPLLKINLKQGKKGFQSRRYKTHVHLLPHLKEFIDTMMEKGFIRKSNSPFSSPVLIVPKPRNADGTSRGFSTCREQKVQDRWVPARRAQFLALLPQFFQFGITLVEAKDMGIAII
eukprot:SAG11_NODE_3424_length_2455_cov_10.236418_3_plen_146_part_00